MGQLKIFPIRRQSQISVGNFGHQQDLGTAAGLFRGEVFLQRLFRVLRGPRVSLRRDDDVVVAAGGETQAKRAGKQRLETKQYTMQDYDLTNFRFNK